MTDLMRKKATAVSVFRFRQVLFGFLSLCLLFLLMTRTEEVLGHVADGLRLCVETVLPALFPFMIVSSLIVSSDALRPLTRLLARPFRALFGIGEESVAAFLLGTVCGCPVSAQCAVSLYENQKISRDEFCRLMTFSNNPSMAFLVGGVGISLFGDRRFGLILYGTTLLSACCVGMAEKRLFGRPSDRTFGSVSAVRPHAKRPALMFTEAVTASARSMLFICGFVVFFTAFTGILETVLPKALHTSELSSLLLGFFEMTGGMAKATACSSPLGLYLCAFHAGWSGLSVHFQVMSIASRSSISFRPYLLAKFCQALLNVLLLGAALLLFGYR